jgi:hypothetical protein
MSILSAADSPSAINYFPFRRMIAFTGAALVFIGLRITPGPLAQSDASPANWESHLAQCDQLSGVGIETLGASGIEIRSDASRGERQSSVRACVISFAK